MTIDNTSPSFSESDFEHLAKAIDAVPESQRELFLAKLVILLASYQPDRNALTTLIPRAQAQLKSI